MIHWENWIWVFKFLPIYVTITGFSWWEGSCWCSWSYWSVWPTWTSGSPRACRRERCTCKYFSPWHGLFNVIYRAMSIIHFSKCIFVLLGRERAPGSCWPWWCPRSCWSAWSCWSSRPTRRGWWQGQTAPLISPILPLWCSHSSFFSVSTTILLLVWPPNIVPILVLTLMYIVSGWGWRAWPEREQRRQGWTGEYLCYRFLCIL